MDLTGMLLVVVVVMALMAGKVRILTQGRSWLVAPEINPGVALPLCGEGVAWVCAHCHTFHLLKRMVQLLPLLLLLLPQPSLPLPLLRDS